MEFKLFFKFNDKIIINVSQKDMHVQHNEKALAELKRIHKRYWEENSLLSYTIVHMFVNATSMNTFTRFLTYAN